MSDTAWNWVALGATVVLFAGLAYLSIRKKAGFSVRVLIATVLGIVVGIAFKGHTDYVAAFGSVWSNAIAAIVVPLLLFSVIAAITNLGESLKLRNIGIKTVVFLLINTFTAALITLGLALLFRVGEGFKFTLPTDYQQREVPAVLDTIVALFPTNLVQNWYSNQVVPVVIFAILVAVAYNSAAKTAKGAAAVKPFKAFVDAGNVVLSKATQIVVGFTPYAVLALIAAAVSNSDVAALLPLVTVLVVAYVAMILQLFVVQPLILSVTTRLSPIPFFKAYWPTGVVAFTSESSIGTIPVTVRNLRSSGVPGDIASFVASLGANLGMPGCAGVARAARCVRSERPGNFVLARPVPVPGGARPACVHRHSGRARHRDDHRDLAVRGGRSADPVHRDQPADLADRRYGPHRPQRGRCRQHGGDRGRHREGPRQGPLLWTQGVRG